MESGRIRQLGSPTEVFRRPANLFVASFIGSTPMNLLPGRVREERIVAAGTELPLPAEARDLVTEGEAVVYGVRPEYLDALPSAEDGAFEGTVSVVENLGGSSLVTLDVADEPVRVVVGEERAQQLAPGDRAWARPRAGRVLLYRDGDLITSDEVPAAAP
ncbi:TOBE domain-containing protein [Actinomadura yumaensis]